MNIDELASEQKAELWNRARQFNKAFDAKECLYPLSDHSSTVIRAHTIQKSRALELIARSGHVYTIHPTFSDVLKSRGVLEPALVGINDATTFHGFCSKHDSDGFRAIDTQEFVATPEQIFLHTYRTFCSELYIKKHAARGFVKPEEIEKIHPSIPKSIYENFVKDQQVRMIAATLKMYQLKARLDPILLAQDYTRLRSFVVTFKKRPMIACSSAFQPASDFAGKPITLWFRPDRYYPFLGVHLFASSNGGVLFFSWFDTAEKELSDFCESFSAVPHAEKTTAIIRMLFEYCENMAVSPDWWESLTESHKRKLMELFLNGIEPGQDHHKSTLVPDGTIIDDWEVEHCFWR